MKKRLDEIPSEQEHKDTVWKKVLIRNSETDGKVATYNYAWLDEHMTVESHSHPDGFEYYVFLEGSGEMLIGEDWFPVAEGDFVVVPVGYLHSVKNPHQKKLIFTTLRTILPS